MYIGLVSEITSFECIHGREIKGPNIDPKIVWLLLQGHPQKGPSIFRNSHNGVCVYIYIYVCVYRVVADNFTLAHMGVSKKSGPSNGSQASMILMTGTSRKGI